ncbi:MAG: glycosyltransferase [Mucilaginibacter sp.]|nr:glycosyltransferase [Mucilaginibacter sp.]
MLRLNIFYEEPDPDRWFKYDRYPRKLIRRFIRGRQRPGGVMMVAINLLKGLDRLDIPYRFNDFKYASKHPKEIVCIIGKPQVLFDRQWKNPIILGAGIFSHPFDYQDIFEQYPNLKKILVPGEWMRQMFEPYYADKVMTCPSGIDTAYWKPTTVAPEKNILIYDKLRPDHDEYIDTILHPVLEFIKANKLSYEYIQYGYYKPQELLNKVNNCQYAIFLSENETQGLAYQQILATGTPVLAWDRGGLWKDPAFYPHKVQFSGVSSVPYWSRECGMKFKNIHEFYTIIPQFTTALENNEFAPRQYILDNLTLEKCATAYINIIKNEYSQIGQIQQNSL